MKEETEIERIDRERKAKHWSWAQFARELGVLPQTVAHWKKRGIPGEWRPKISQLFSRSIDYIQTGKEKLVKPNDINWKHLADSIEVVDELEEKITRGKWKMNPEIRSKVIIDIYRNVPIEGKLPSSEVLELFKKSTKGIGGSDGIGIKAGFKKYHRGRNK